MLGEEEGNHIADPRFGERMLDRRGNVLPGEITALMKTKADVDGFTAEMLLREAYEIDFGILDHRVKSNQTPMALVRMNPKEDPSSYSAYFSLMRRYVKYEIRELFGYTPDEFMALPRELVAFYFQLAIEKLEEKTRKTTDVVNELERQANGKKGGG